MFNKDRKTISEFLVLFIALILLISLCCGCKQSKHVVYVPVTIHDTIEHDNIIREYINHHDTIFRDSIHIEYIDTGGIKTISDKVVVYKSKDNDRDRTDSISDIHKTTPAEEIAESVAETTEYIQEATKLSFWEKLRYAIGPFVIGLAVGVGAISFFIIWKIKE